MNAWRWLGASLVLVALSLGMSAQGQDKDKGGKGGKDKDGTAQKKDKTGEKKGDKTGEKQPDKGSGEKLEWKAFQEGKSFFQEMTTATDQKMKVMQMEVTQNQKQTFYIKWTTEKVTDKTYTVRQEIIGVKMDIEIGGNKISFDSTASEQPNNPLTDFFKALVGAKFTLTIDKKDMKVTDVKGQEDFINNLSKANPQLKTLLETILSKDALKQMADPIFAVVPDNGTVPGDKTWKRETKLAMGPIGTYDTTYTYKLAGIKDKTATIDVTTALTYKAPTGKDDKGLPFKIVNANLKSDKGSGKVLFNVEKGRVESSEMDLDLNGTLTIDIAGMSTEVELKQTQKSTLKTSDTDPIPSKKK